MAAKKTHTDSHLLLLLSLLLLVVSTAFLFREYLLRLPQAANVGMYAVVEETEMNKLAQEITEKEQELETREQELQKREAALETRFVASRDQTALIYTTLIGLLLLALILLNFLLDAKREAKRRQARGGRPEARPLG